PGLQNPQNTLKTSPVRCWWSAALVSSPPRLGQQKLNQLPLRIGQQLLSILHDKSSPANLPQP
ncbi:MAG TPA: hypothetical protein VIJ93_01515, partial [bacterium]